MTNTLPSSCRLRFRRDFVYLAQRGRVFRTEFFLVQWTKTSFPRVRFGVTVSKSFGGAVERNLFRRHAKEAFRTSSLRQFQGFDINLKARTKHPVAFREFCALFKNLEPVLLGCS